MVLHVYSECCRGTRQQWTTLTGHSLHYIPKGTMACMSIVNAVGDPTTVDHSDRALSILHTKGDDGLHVYSECCRGPDNSGPL